MEAFSLAASIMQVIDFGSNFVITAIAIYRSSSSTPDDLLAVRSLQTNSESLGAVLGTLKADSSRLANRSSGNENDGIIALANECSKALQKMLDTLEIVKPSKTGNIWKAMKSAVALKWNESSLSALQSQLNDFKHQISLNLLVSVRQYSQKSVTQQDEILRRLDQLTADTSASAREPIPSIDQSGFGSSIIQLLTRRLGQEDGEAERVRLRTAIISAMLSGDDDIETSSSILLTDDHRKSLEAMFLAALHYESMADRELAISDAHEATFHWIFQNSEHETAKWSSFTDWLKSDEQVYWITGKAGSGKSTLMKFLTQPHQSRDTAESSRNLPLETRCTKYLGRWAGDQRLIMASFYFWAAGTTAQKSHKGLFKTLLSQLLRAFPEAIPFTSPKQWGVLSLFDEVTKEVPERELRNMFKRAMRHISSKAKVALFVDGLDEFEGDLEPLISTMRDVVSHSSSVKLCTASRPWNEFQEAFKDLPSLRLQDLTRFDIQKYVEARFNENQKYMALRDRETGLTEHLVSSVVSKASGVFLWVKIVVTSLLAGLSQADRPSDLKRRLDDLPEDLEGLYERILDNIDPFYLKHATEYFTLMKTCPEPPPALLFSFADEENLLDLPGRLLSNNVKKYGTDYLSDRVQDITTRLNSRCKGLLEVAGSIPKQGSRRPIFVYPGPKIQYLHRTVRDFIGSPNTTRRLGRYLPDSYDPHLTLVYASIVLDARCSSHLKLYQMMSDVMYHADRVSPNSTQELVRGLDHFCDSLSTRYANNRRFYLGLRSGNGVYNAMSLEQQFLCLAIEYGVVGYIDAKVDDGGSILLSRDHLLEISFREFSPTSLRRPLWNFVKRGFKIPTTVSYSLLHIPFLHLSPLGADRQAEVVKALLKRGADPNQEFKFRRNGAGAVTTPWRLFIGEIICAFLSTSRSARKARLAALGEIARLMIDYGANVDPSNVEAAIKLLADETERDYVLSRPAWSVHKAVYSALRRMKKDRASWKLEFDKEHQRYLGGGALKLNQDPPVERLPYRQEPWHMSCKT
ncbi:hypothetical protein B0J15DRAFT_574019 [Fusarium solani]|uniref:NACHT domain-containing protein n=1 Tax=Fusarium solani TaxID=169388 RepID=A0A9P9L399_FUSSL|nr:uncharacterized protein B0J15DRAFT_574019 [Fusarium solani]KAH7273155.1 hypothetical protein B0J15DRAFT_574019 [Fusarium solani]